MKTILPLIAATTLMNDNNVFMDSRKYETGDTTNYGGNLARKGSKKIRKGAGEKKLSRKQRKQQIKKS